MDLYFSEIKTNLISIYTKIKFLKYVFVSFINALTFKIVIAFVMYVVINPLSVLIS